VKSGQVCPNLSSDLALSSAGSATCLIYNSAAENAPEAGANQGQITNAIIALEEVDVWLSNMDINLL
jgi:hypothetical protein